jgi:hypothetical protein
MAEKPADVDLLSLRVFLDDLPLSPCDEKLPDEYCSICRKVNSDVYFECQKLRRRLGLVMDSENDGKPRDIEEIIRKVDKKLGRISEEKEEEGSDVKFEVMKKQDELIIDPFAGEEGESDELPMIEIIKPSYNEPGDTLSVDIDSLVSKRQDVVFEKIEEDGEEPEELEDAPIFELAGPEEKKAPAKKKDLKHAEVTVEAVGDELDLQNRDLRHEMPDETEEQVPQLAIRDETEMPMASQLVDADGIEIEEAVAVVEDEETTPEEGGDEDESPPDEDDEEPMEVQPLEVEPMADDDEEADEKFWGDEEPGDIEDDDEEILVAAVLVEDDDEDTPRPKRAIKKVAKKKATTKVAKKTAPKRTVKRKPKKPKVPVGEPVKQTKVKKTPPKKKPAQKKLPKIKKPKDDSVEVWEVQTDADLRPKKRPAAKRKAAKRRKRK